MIYFGKDINGENIVELLVVEGLVIWREGMRVNNFEQNWFLECEE